MKGIIKKNYYWIIAFVMLLEMAVYGGLLNNQVGLYIIPVSESLGSTRSEFSLALSFNNIVAFISVMFSGILVSRFGNKKMLVVGLCSAAIAYLIYSSSQNITGMAIGSAILGLSAGFSSSATASRVIGSWFHRYRGTVLGVVSASTGVGGALLCMLFADVIENHSWQASYLLSAVFIVIILILVLVFIRNKPSDMGLNPYGMGYVSKKAKNKRTEDHWLGLTMQQLIRRPSFYLMIVCTFLSCTCTYLAFSVVLPHLQDQGLTSTEAATLQGAMMILLAVGKVLCGVLSDKFGPKIVMVGSLVLNAVGLWTLSSAENMASASIAITIYSLGIPMCTIIPPLLSYSLFGYQSHNASLGIIVSMASLSSLVSTPLSNLVYDKFGSYSPSFHFAAILSIAVIPLYALLYILTAKDRKKIEDKIKY